MMMTMVAADQYERGLEWARGDSTRWAVDHQNLDGRVGGGFNCNFCHQGGGAPALWVAETGN